jgi:hypothetical protein
LERHKDSKIISQGFAAHPDQPLLLFPFMETNKCEYRNNLTCIHRFLTSFGQENDVDKAAYDGVYGLVESVLLPKAGPSSIFSRPFASLGAVRFGSVYFQAKSFTVNSCMFIALAPCY